MPIDVRDAQAVYKDAGENIIFQTLLLKRDDQAAELAAIQDLAENMQSVINSMVIRYPEGRLSISFGLSAAAWTYLFPNAPRPKELETFTTIEGPKYVAPATGGDLFFHVRAQTAAITYEVMDQLGSFIQAATTVLDETHGFRYFEGRAIIGFVDGTENPATVEGADYALIGEEDPEFINGSYAFAQKYIHNMDAWKALKTEDQEKAIGRRKFSDKELPDDEKLKNAHNVVSQDNENGVEHKIVRMNVPYSDQGVTGTYFIGYAREWAITKRMLTSMLTNSDRLLDFSTPITGEVFFVPSKTVLAKIADDEL
ncbi:Dyp-type peroxidase [Loigolactobacillus jiayinensis]|uniref:Dyp-type peroxidase n=1 Tax=Loigolactobacillus jiayinensis TaxID=2486016 RepID=A0ABW1RIZ7_9LACO|nr:Dyp-type peroxidase [Loigolactobacillus jiayinensis]